MPEKEHLEKNTGLLVTTIFLLILGILTIVSPIISYLTNNLAFGPFLFIMLIYGIIGLAIVDLAIKLYKIELVTIQNLPWTFVLLSLLSIWHIYKGHNIYCVTLIMSLICMTIVNFIKEDYKKIAEKRAFQKELKRKGSFLWRLENDYPDPSIFYVLIFLMMFINFILVVGWGITHATKEEIWNDLDCPPHSGL